MPIISALLISEGSCKKQLLLELSEIVYCLLLYERVLEFRVQSFNSVTFHRD